VRGLIDAYAVANTVRMARTVRRHATAVLVEGSKDVRVYRNFVEERVCDVIPAESKRNALGALRLLRQSGEKGVLVIADADFSPLSGTKVSDPDVLFTDGHDLECMLLQSPALAKLLVEYDLSPTHFGGDLGMTLARTVQLLGYLRFASWKFGLQLDFKAIDFTVFTKSGLPPEVDDDAMVGEVLKRSRCCRDNAIEVRKRRNGLIDAAHDPWVVSCGHDMTALLALLLSRTGGRVIPPSTVERQLRLSYETAHFRLTPLYLNIQEWERRNPSYRILKTF